MSLPSHNRALVVSEKGKVTFKELAPPLLGEDQILVRTKAFAINPTDWKHIDFIFEPGRITGSDFAGDIVTIGSKAQDKGFSVGDPVAGYIRGAFQEYVAILPDSVWHKPASLPYEDAAPMGGVALSTAVQALHHRLGMTCDIDRPEPFLVWAGSTGVGMYSIKLASLAGYRVVTTASKHNWDLVKSLGADAAFDYRDPEVIANIRQWVLDKGIGPLKKGLDAMSEKGSTEKCVDILGEGADLITLLPADEPLDTKGVNVLVTYVFEGTKPENTDDFRRMVEWNKRLPGYIEAGKLPKGVVPLKVFRGGMEDLPEAIDYVRQGKTSGQKVVVTMG